MRKGIGGADGSGESARTDQGRREEGKTMNRKNSKKAYV
jgi:hypothetical protein